MFSPGGVSSNHDNVRPGFTQPDRGGFPNSPEAIAGFANYAVELARQTRGQVAMFEVWNEWVGGCGMTGRPIWPGCSRS